MAAAAKPPTPAPPNGTLGRGPDLQHKPGAWASIASLNISKRNKTNTLEIRLDKEQGVGFSLSSEDIERLLRRLKVNSSQFSMVQACPERKNMVYITFAPGVDLQKFMNQNESFILKDGVRTTMIRPVGQREVSVTVFGLHPDTRDTAVIDYLNAHGVVNRKDPIVYGVYPGSPGSNILAGKLNGNRSYMVEIKKSWGHTMLLMVRKSLSSTEVKSGLVQIATSRNPSALVRPELRTVPYPESSCQST